MNSRLPASALPLVSIGMPLYNAERYLRQALDSLVAQDYERLEIIISDNASTDATQAICQEYAARDSRVRYYRAERNMGAVWNFNRVFRLSHGKYFAWAAFDDLRAPEFVSRCAVALEKRPDAVLCCTGVRLIDEEGQDFPVTAEFLRIPPLGRSPKRRMQAIARATYWYDFYGLIRSATLATTRLAQPVWGFDVLLSLELCLRGAVIYVPGDLFSYRMFHKKSGESAAATLGAENKEGSIPLSWTDLSLEMAVSILRAPLSIGARADILIAFLRAFCLGNGTVRWGIRTDAWPSIRRSISKHSYLKSVGLGMVAALVLCRGILVKLLPWLRSRAE